MLHCHGQLMFEFSLNYQRKKLDREQCDNNILTQYHSCTSDLRKGGGVKDEGKGKGISKVQIDLLQNKVIIIRL